MKKKTTTIRTTADLFSHQERIDHISKMASWIEEDRVEIISSAGIHHYEFIDNEWKIVIQLKLAGVDDFHRPVFKDINSRNYYGDCDGRKTGKPADVIEYYKEHTDQLEYFGLHFNCEPNGGTNDRIKFEIIG